MSAKEVRELDEEVKEVSAAEEGEDWEEKNIEREEAEEYLGQFYTYMEDSEDL